MLEGFADALIMLALLLAASIAVGAGLLRMIGMYFDREIGGGELAVWTMAYVAAFGATIAAWGTPVAPLLALLTLGLALVYPVGIYLIEKRGLQQMRQEDIQAYLQAAQEHPEIPYPYQRLGDIFYGSEDFGLAAKYYQAYLKMRKDPRVKARLQQCERRRRLAQTNARICPQCGAENPRNVTHCIECGEPQPGLWEILEQFRGTKSISLLLWCVGISLGLALILAFIGILHPIIAIPLYAIAIIALAIYLYVRVSSF